MNLRKYFIALVPLIYSFSAYAADSYRFLHVTIETPWTIFIFLLLIVMFPFVLMAVLYWYFAFKKNKEVEDNNQKTLQD